MKLAQITIAVLFGLVLLVLGLNVNGLRGRASELEDGKTELTGQIELLQQRVTELEQQPSYIEEVTTLSDLRERGCESGAEAFEQQMADRGYKYAFKRQAELCNAIASDMQNGNQMCAGAYQSCRHTLCSNFSSTIASRPEAQSFCMGSIEPWNNFGQIRSPAIIERGRIRNIR